MKPSVRRWCFALLAVVLLAGAATRVSPLNRERERLRLLAAPIPETARPSMMLTPMLALGRAPLVDYLWLRAGKLKDQGHFFDALQLSKLICELQPRFASVWAFQAWNMAYNISVTLDAPEERWRWVKNGAELLRDKAIPLNPHNIQLYRELAWIYFHKIGDWTDEKHYYYKLQLALQIEDVLGRPPKDWSRPGRNEGEFYRTYDYQPLADAPKEWAEIAREPGIVAVVDSLRPYGFDAAKPGVYLGVLDGLRDGKLGIPTAEPGDEVNRLHALAEMMAQPETAEARLRLERFWRAWRLRNEFKIEPAYLLQIQKDLGGAGLDLRVPWTHALYWAVMGLEQGIERKVLIDTNRLNTQRIEFFCLQKLFDNGRMQMSPEAEKGVPPLFTPDLRFGEVLFEIYVRDAGQFEIDKKGKPPVGSDFFTGFVGVTRRIALRYAEQGNREKAREKYEFLTKYYPDPFYGQTLDDFLNAQMVEDRKNPDLRVAMARMTAIIERGLYYLVYDEDEEGNRYIIRAKQLFDTYRKDIVSQRMDIPTDFNKVVAIVAYEYVGRMGEEVYKRVCAKLNIVPGDPREKPTTTAPMSPP